MKPIASIIIPAHNEQAVIWRCMVSLLSDSAAGELDVIVVCNGCTDATEKIVASLGDAVTLVSTPVGSKSNAINLGFAAARARPIIVLDADIRLTAAAVRKMVESMARTGVEVASPRMAVEGSGASAAVRAFYRVWLTLPYFKTAIGGGVYALSASGLNRVGAIPAITADDAFVRLKFAPEERAVIESCSFEVTPPRTLRDLIHIKTRSRRGNLQLLSEQPELKREDARSNRDHLLRLARKPSFWPAMFVYGLVVVTTSVLAHWKHWRKAHQKWERDESSRKLIAGGAA